MTRGSIVRIAAYAALALALGGTPAFAGGGAAQAVNPDARWVPWLGCWQLLQDNQDDRADFDAEDFVRDRTRPARPAGTVESVADLTVCVTPSGRDGVAMTTRSDGAVLFEDSVVADGARHALTGEACRGWQRAEWSVDGDRLYAEAEIACGAQPVRHVSGLTMMAAGGTWLDIQVVTIEGSDSTRVRRYRRAADREGAGLSPALLERAERATFVSGGRPFTVQDVIEASGKINPQAIEVALVETDARFDLDRHTLIMLDEADIDDHVIDLMVALSYPERFRFERRASIPAVPYYGARGAFGYDPYWYGLDGYGPYYYYYYAPFGYTGWGYYSGYSPYYRFGGPAIFVPGRVDSRRGSRGQVVNGRGYTRVRPRGAAGGTSSGTARRRRGGSSSQSSGGGSGGSSSSGGTVTPQGATSGGSGDTGRTAVPR